MRRLHPGSSSAASREERSKLNHKRAARVRMSYRAHLAWLEGYPVAAHSGTLDWQCVPRRGALERVPIGPMELSRARRALNEMARERGATEGDAAGDGPLPTLERLDAALTLAGLAAQRGVGAVDPSSLLAPRAAAIVRAWDPRKGPVSIPRAVAWSAASTAEQLAALRWVDAHAVELGQLPALLAAEDAPRLACVLARLACDVGDKHVAPVLSLLCNPDLYRVVTATQPTPGTEPRSRGSFGAAIEALVEATLPLGTAARGRALRLLVNTAPLQWIQRWKDYWFAWEAWRRDSALAKGKGRVKGRPKRSAGSATAAPEPPPALHARTLSDVILAECVASGDPATALDQLLHALPSEVDVPGVRARLLVILHHAMKGPDADRVPPSVVRAWATVLHSQPQAFELLRPSKAVSCAPLDSRLRHGYIEVLDSLPSRGNPRTVIESLVELAPLAPSPHWRLVFGVFEQLVNLGRAPAWAAAAAGAAAPHLREVTVWRIAPAVVELAASLCDESVDSFASVLGPLASSEQIATKGVPGMVAFFRDIDAIESLRGEILERRLARIHRWTQAFAVLEPKNVKLAGCAPASDPAWLRKYPKPLRAALSDLARLPDAQARADRLLRRAVPTRDALKRELAYVRERLAGSVTRALQSREAALVERLASGTRLRSCDVDKLSEKVRRAAWRARIGLADTAIEEAVFAAVAPRLRCTSKPSWWQRDDALAIVVAVSSLPAAERRLGTDLLAARCGPPPWLPWAHPKNQAFLARMAALGVRTAPWLESAPLVITSAAGRSISLALEADPLEILLMGERFSTCLSLGSFNFFSSVVNAVDVNKRVLYARTAEGNVAGRCLLALTDQGKLLTFEPYAHDRTIEFDKLVAEAARRLADAMSTHVAASGPVSPLLAARWYDDGPRDLTGQMAALAEGSLLRRELETVEPEEVVELLETRLAPQGLDETTLPRILHLPEVGKRPALVVALARKVASAAFLPWQTRIHCSAVLRTAGESALSQRVLHAPGLWAWLLTPCPECGAGCYPNLDYSLGLLVDVDPFFALRALRRTRPRGVRAWEDEREHRLLHAAKALRAMGRLGQAKRLLERGLRAASGGGLVASFREQLGLLA